MTALTSPGSPRLHLFEFAWGPGSDQPDGGFRSIWCNGIRPTSVADIESAACKIYQDATVQAQHRTMDAQGHYTYWLTSAKVGRIIARTHEMYRGCAEAEGDWYCEGVADDGSAYCKRHDDARSLRIELE